MGNTTYFEIVIMVGLFIMIIGIFVVALLGDRKVKG